MNINNSETKQNFPRFNYPIAHDPMLPVLKKTANIELNESNSEIDNAKIIIGFAHSVFSHNGDNTPSASDPLTILNEAKTGQSFRCVEYSVLAAGLLWANGVPARTIGLKTSDVETRKYGAGHVVIEFWSKQFNKWIMADVQTGLIPGFHHQPLSAFELSKKLKENENVDYIPVPGAKLSANSSYSGKPSYSEWIKEYLYFIDTPIHLTLNDEGRRLQQIAMLVPEGVKPPKKFQGMFEMNAVYTHNASDFYPNLS